MLRESKLNLFLFFLLIALVIGALLVNFPGDNPHIININIKNIHRIIIKTPDQPQIEINKTGDNWTLQDKGKEEPANLEKIHRLLSLSNVKSINQFKVIDTELNKYELSPPHLTVYLNELAIHFGGLEPISHMRYIQVGQNIHLVKDELYRQLLSDRTTFIQH